jgi:hypothetical protein
LYDCIIYTGIIFKSVKHFKNAQQIDYATNHDNSDADRESNSPRIFQGNDGAHNCPYMPLGDSSNKYGVQEA